MLFKTLTSKDKYPYKLEKVSVENYFIVILDCNAINATIMNANEFENEFD